MKKVLNFIYSLVVVACVGYGIPLMIVNIGKDRFVLYLCISIVGIVLLGIGATVIFLRNRKNKQ